MIDFPLDEAFCLDFVTILEVKLEKAKKTEKPLLAAKLKFYLNNLGEKLGDIKLEAIRNSVEYKRLLDCNRDIYELVDYCYKYSTEMKLSAELNMKRFELKNQLQKKFFGKITSEIKLTKR